MSFSKVNEQFGDFLARIQALNGSVVSDNMLCQTLNGVETITF